MGLAAAYTPGWLSAQVKAEPTREHRIAGVELFPYALESKQVTRIALGKVAAEGVFVRLRTGEGLVGWGEASPYAPITGEMQASCLAIGKRLAQVVQGRDVFDLARIVADMDAVAAANPSIKAALEMALWDLCGKLARQPVCYLLGRYRDSFETDRTVYLDEPPAMADKAKEIVREGYKVVKVKVGQSPELDVARVRAIRTAIGEKVRIRIDANQGWTRDTALKALWSLEEFDVEFCEQPVASSDWEGLRQVSEHSRIPIMADESVHGPSDAIECVRRGAANLINIKLMKSGGILKSMHIAAIAEAAHMQCMLGSMVETRLALTAAAHVVAAQKCVVYADLDTFTEHKIDPVVGGMQVKDGLVTVPQTPGLGVDVEADFLKTLKPA
ncbi:MAG: dipeptide epimerase [Planctomycetes bacterium]|nr:dipeptide epimerase [Planctomycetota bacterium]